MVCVTTHLVVGPPEHGVTSYAARMAQASAGCSERVDLPDPGPPVDLDDRRVLVHFTDRLFGPDAVSAARRLVVLTARAERLTVVLHDVPQASDGRPREQRSEGYLRVCAAADAVVVNSDHEALLLRALARCRGEAFAADLGRRTHVVPLPVPRPPLDLPDPVPDAPPTVATLGFVYPGKGLEEVIDAAATLTPPPRVVNLGRASAGHDDVVAQLTRRAERCGVEWSTTGWLPDDALLARLRSVTVPVAAHRHLSASGSINSWLGAGRRPVVTRSRYAQELARRLPGALTLVDHLAPAIARALTDPACTWLEPGASPGRGDQDVARALVQVAQGPA